MRHPYTFFSAGDVAAYFAERRKRPDWDAFYASVAENAEKALLDELVTVEQAEGNKRSQHANYGALGAQASRFYGTLGLKYLIDRDERCAAKIRDFLLRIIGFERWHSDSYLKRIPVAWHSDLSSAGTTLCTAMLYDIVYDALSADERDEISRGILGKGVYPTLRDWVLPGSRIHALDSMGHNWWAVCIGEAAVAYLAVSDNVPEDERRRTVDCVDRALAGYFEFKGDDVFNKIRSFDEKGLFYEGTDYSCFGTGTLLRYLYCRERHYGRCDVIRDAMPEGLCDALMLTSYPYTEGGATRFGAVDFGDCSFDVNHGSLIRYACVLGIDTPGLRAVARTQGSDVFAELEGYRPDKLEGDLSGLPLYAVFPSGVAVCRDSWEPDSTLFAVRSGPCWNHAHNDAGTFVIYHKGRPLFIDSGSCDYTSELYHDYYCQDRAHSTVLVGGEGRRDEELYRGTKFTPSITDSFYGGGLFYVRADAAGPMAHLCSRLFRNFFWLDGRVLVVFDEILAHREATAQFTLHFDGEYKKEADGSVVIDRGDTKARLITHHPEKTELSERIGHKAHEQDKDVPYIVVSTVDKRRDHLLIDTIELDGPSDGAAYERLVSDNAEGLRVTTGQTVRDFIFNRYADGHVMHDNTNNTLGGYDTDAYMIVVTRDVSSGEERVLVVCGSYLRRDGESLFESFAKTTAEVKTK